MTPTPIRVFFEAELVIDADDYERSEDAATEWDASRLADAVQDEIGHTGVVVLTAYDWKTP